VKPPEQEKRPEIFRFRSAASLAERMRALAKREGLTIQSLMAEAIYRHVHHLETYGRRRNGK
jgi:predicted DNA-binding protein